MTPSLRSTASRPFPRARNPNAGSSWCLRTPEPPTDRCELVAGNACFAPDRQSGILSASLRRRILVALPPVAAAPAVGGRSTDEVPGVAGVRRGRRLNAEPRDLDASKTGGASMSLDPSL